MAYGQRDGFTRNEITGRHDRRSLGLLRQGAAAVDAGPAWEARAIVSGERARDGDYALARSRRRCAAIPFHAARDFEGFTHRDIVNTTVLARREGAASRVLDDDRVRALEDGGRDRPRLLAAAARHPRERRGSLPVHAGGARSPRRPTPRSASPYGACRSGGRPACSCSRRTTIRTPSTTLRRSCSRRFSGFPSARHRRRRRSTTWASACTARPRRRLRDRLDVTAGARFDYETKDGELSTFYTPAIAPPTDVVGEESFSNVSPQVAVAFRPADRPHGLCVTVARVQGGRLQPGLTGRPRGVRRGAHLARRRRGEDVVGRPRVGERRRVLHRLGRPAAEPARSGGARRSSTSPTSAPRRARASRSR